jgi:ribosomal protein S18 acetylase RimI-like enzyme
MNLANVGSCRCAVESDIPSVARIHLAAFNGFFLSQLGFRFLCVMYQAFLKSPLYIFVVHETASGELDGFAVGTFKGQNDRWLALRFLPQFIVAIFPAVLRNPLPVVKRLLVRFFSAGELLLLPSNATVLRSIGVLPTTRGSGAAASLMQAFEALAIIKGSKLVFLTTDEMNNERAQRFYERCGYQRVVLFEQYDVRRMWVMSKNLNSSDN